jgi:Arc/MetJ-type ribon-helix-helix transcriptional regulator
MKRKTPNPRVHTTQVSVSVPEVMAQALTLATQDGLISVADYVRLALRSALQRDGLYTPHARQIETPVEHQAA